MYISIIDPSPLSTNTYMRVCSGAYPPARPASAAAGCVWFRARRCRQQNRAFRRSPRHAVSMYVHSSVPSRRSHLLPLRTTYTHVKVGYMRGVWQARGTARVRTGSAIETPGAAIGQVSRPGSRAVWRARASEDRWDKIGGRRPDSPASVRPSYLVCACNVRDGRARAVSSCLVRASPRASGCNSPLSICNPRVSLITPDMERRCSSSRNYYARARAGWSLFFSCTVSVGN